MKTSRTPLPPIDAAQSLSAWEAFGVRCLTVPRATRPIPRATIPTTAPDPDRATNDNPRRAAALKAAETRRRNAAK